MQFYRSIWCKDILAEDQKRYWVFKQRWKYWHKIPTGLIRQLEAGQEEEVDEWVEMGKLEVLTLTGTAGPLSATSDL